jgi:hypothetical protein
MKVSGIVAATHLIPYKKSYTIKDVDGKITVRAGDGVTMNVIGNNHGSNINMAASRKASLGNGRRNKTGSM